MDDLISRETALKALEEISYGLWEIDIPSPTVPEYIEHHEQVQSVMKLVDEWARKIQAAMPVPAEPQWTPCKERLPNETEPWPVLCWIDDPLQNRIVGNPCYHDASYTGYSVVDGYGNVIARNCLAWTPLPEAYEDQKDG